MSIFNTPFNQFKKWLSKEQRFPLESNGNVATRMIAGRMINIINNTNAYTWELTVSLAEHADAVQWIFASSKNGGIATDTPNILAYHYAPTEFADVDAATFATGISFNNGSPGGGVALSTTTVDSETIYTLSDWMPLSTKDRTDGGKYPLVSCRCWVNGGARLIMLGGGANDNYDNWSTRPVTERQHRIRRATAGGNQANTPFVGALASSCPIVGVRYQARGRVYTMMFDGDSNEEGQGTYKGESWGMKMAEMINDMNLGFRVETAQCSWAGAGTNVWMMNIKNRYNAGIIPDLHFIQSCSPNNINPPITADKLATSRQHIGLAISRAVAKKPVIPILVNFAPSNYSVKAYGASDALRVDYNNKLPSRGFDTFDKSSIVSGPVDANGQVTIKPEFNIGDNIHFNDAANIAVAVEGLKVARKYLPI